MRSNLRHYRHRKKADRKKVVNLGVINLIFLISWVAEIVRKKAAESACKAQKTTLYTPIRRMIRPEKGLPRLFKLITLYAM